MEISLQQEFYVKCDKCGSHLDANESRGTIEVKPCRACRDAEYDKGREDGLAETEKEQGE
jgi:hypothetical protein